MLLKRLVEYSKTIPIPPKLYGNVRVKWLINLSTDGELLGPLIPLTGDGKNAEKGKILLAPSLKRSGTKPKPLLLCDNGGYVLGRIPEGKKPERIKAQHKSFVQVTNQCAENTGIPEVNAVATFLESVTENFPEVPGGFDASHNITFRVEDALTIENLDVQQWWGEYASSEKGIETQCLICGKEKFCVERHPIPIKRIRGGQSTGMSIVSANSDAFESYNLSASLIAPTCLDCAERYAKALNELLANETNSLGIGNTTYVFWTRDKGEFNPFSILSRPEPDEIKDLLKTPFSGRERDSVDEDAFYAASFTASAARVVVRDWIETTIPTVKANLAHWFRRQEMVDAWGDDGKPLGIYALVKGLYRDVNKDMAPEVPRLLLKSALCGDPLPDYILYQAVKRMRADPAPSKNGKEDNFTFFARMMVIRLVLNSKKDKEENYMSKLEFENTTPAYVCGRLLAVIESIQRAAIPGTKATLIDRYYGAASSAPASIFGTLMRGAQPHLAKLRKEKEGAYHALQGRIEEICALLPEYPLSLNMKQQAIFALGYYHQRATDRAGARAHKDKSGNAIDNLDKEEKNE